MTGTFEIKSQTNNSTFEYRTSQMIIQGGFAKDIQTGAVQTINGSCYRVGQDGSLGAFFGNFNGFARDGQEIKYSMSEMSRQDANQVWDAIDEIEPLITGEDNE